MPNGSSLNSQARQKKRLYWGVLLIALTGFFGLASFTAHPPQLFKRAPASKKTLRQEPASPIKMTKKIKGPLSTSIKASARTGSQLTLTGHVKSHQDLKKVKTRWLLPQGVKIVSGPENVPLYELKAGESETFELTVQLEGSTNKKVHLHASAVKNRARFSARSQYNTELESTIEQQKAKLQKRTQHYLKQEDKDYKVIY